MCSYPLMDKFRHFAWLPLAFPNLKLMGRVGVGCTKHIQYQLKYILFGSVLRNVILWQLIQYSQQPLSFGESVQWNFDHRHLWTKTKEETLLGKIL